MRLTHFKHGTVLLDDEDAWVVDRYFLQPSVNKRGYALVSATCKKTRKKSTLARVLLGITDSRLQADHINQDGFDNRRENLRIVERDLQSANRAFASAYGYKGVHLNGKRYRGSLRRHGRLYYGPRRPCPELSALDYNRMAIALWGNEVFLNIVPCISMEPRPSERDCMFCNASCYCCCVCSDPPSAGMSRLFALIDASVGV